MSVFGECCDAPCGSVSLRSSALTRAATSGFTLLSSWTNASTVAADDLVEFTHVGSGKLRYDGDEARAFLCIATISIKYDAFANGTVQLALFFGANISTPSLSSSETEAATHGVTVTYHKVRILNPGDTVEI